MRKAAECDLLRSDQGIGAVLTRGAEFERDVLQRLPCQPAFGAHLGETGNRVQARVRLVREAGQALGETEIAADAQIIRDSPRIIATELNRKIAVAGQIADLR